MKIVINSCYGGFGLSDFAVEALGLESRFDFIDRIDHRLIKLIEDYGAEKVGDDYSALTVAIVPDAATDWTIEEYDGLESIIYVLDGKLHYAY